MTEAEWLGAGSPLGMLGWLCETRGPSGLYVRHQPVSERKLRLFACACCRAAWHLLSDERSRRAVEAAERLADGWGAAAVADLNAASQAVGNWAMDHDERVRAAKAAYFCLAQSAYVSTVCGWLSRSVPGDAGAALLRDVVGNPFRPAALGRALLGCARCNGVALDDHGCPCRYGALREAAPLGRAAYDERLPGGACAYCGGRGRRRAIQEAPDSERACPRCGGAGSLPGGALGPARLAVLSDALEEAGCDDDGILGHLRAPGPHYRGCWALDLVLGLS